MTPRGKRGVSFEQVTELALTLPGVAVSPSYGTPSLKVKGALFARLKEDGETLVLKVDRVSRDFIISAHPDRFFLTDHYRDYPYVLVRLAKVTRSEMRQLLEDAWELAAPAKLRAAWKQQTQSARGKALAK